MDNYSKSQGRTIPLKIDVEGYEFNILQGMRRTFRDNNCYLMVEIFPENLVKCDEVEASPAERLGDRELKVFQMIRGGHSTRRIAEFLSLEHKRWTAIVRGSRGSCNGRWHQLLQKAISGSKNMTTFTEKTA